MQISRKAEIGFIGLGRISAYLADLQVETK